MADEQNLPIQNLPKIAKFVANSVKCFDEMNDFELCDTIRKTQLCKSASGIDFLSLSVPIVSVLWDSQIERESDVCREF